MLSILKNSELIYSNVQGTFHLPDKAEVNNASQHTTYRWKIHWHLPEKKRKKIIFFGSREYIQLHLPNRSLHPPMKQSTRMLGMLAEMVEILIQPLVSTLIWFTASLASWLSIVKMVLQLLVGSVGESRSLRQVVHTLKKFCLLKTAINHILTGSGTFDEPSDFNFSIWVILER